MKPSALKFAAIDGGNSRFKVLAEDKSPIFIPSLASHADNMLVSPGAHMTCETQNIPLMIGDEPWFAGLNAHDTSAAPVLFEGVALSDEHHALFLESLHRLDADTIKVLAMGLPSSSFDDEALRKSMVGKYQKTHDVRGRKVKVVKVGVFDQTIGTARRYVSDIGNVAGEITFLVVDFGGGTTNLAVVVAKISPGNVQLHLDRRYSMSEWQAMSNVCQATARKLSSVHGGSITPHQINAALQGGDAKLQRLGRDPVDFTSALSEAAGELAAILVSKIKTRLRGKSEIDRIILTGGGAPLFLDSFKAAFDYDISVIKNNGTANVEGLLLLAKDYAG